MKIYFPKIYGLHTLGENKLLYISRGTGTWGPPVRVFAPPEITVIDLIGKKIILVLLWNRIRMKLPDRLFIGSERIFT